MPRRVVSPSTGPRRHFGRGGLLVIVGITCVTILVAAMTSIALQKTDLHAISSKEQEQMHNHIHTKENLEKFKKEMRKLMRKD
jgi:hypothetical protein